MKQFHHCLSLDFCVYLVFNMLYIDIDLEWLMCRDMSRNKITRIGSVAFNGSLSLSQIDLSWNQLVDISSSTFSNMMHLSSIRLSNNRLRHLPLGVFSTNQLLFDLDIRNNSIREVNPGALLGPKSLARLQCEGNQFNCNCAQEWSRNSNWTTKGIVPSDLSCVCGQCHQFCPCSNPTAGVPCFSIGPTCSCRSEIEELCGFLPSPVGPVLSTTQSSTSITFESTQSPSSEMAGGSNHGSSNAGVVATTISHFERTPNMFSSSVPPSLPTRSTPVLFSTDKSGSQSPIAFVGAGVGGAVLIIAVIITVILILRCQRKRAAFNDSKRRQSESNEYSEGRLRLTSIKLSKDKSEMVDQNHRDIYESRIQTNTVHSTSTSSGGVEKDMASQTGYASTRRVDEDGYYEGAVRSDSTKKDRAAYMALVKENRQVQAEYASTKRNSTGVYYEAALNDNKLPDQNGYASLKPTAGLTESLYTSRNDGYEKPKQHFAVSNVLFEKESDLMADGYEKPIEGHPKNASMNDHTSPEDPYYAKLVE